MQHPRICRRAAVLNYIWEQNIQNGPVCISSSVLQICSCHCVTQNIWQERWRGNKVVLLNHLYQYNDHFGIHMGIFLLISCFLLPLIHSISMENVANSKTMNENGNGDWYHLTISSDHKGLALKIIRTQFTVGIPLGLCWHYQKYGIFASYRQVLWETEVIALEHYKNCLKFMLKKDNLRTWHSWWIHWF